LPTSTDYKRIGAARPSWGRVRLAPPTLALALLAAPHGMVHGQVAPGTVPSQIAPPSPRLDVPETPGRIELPGTSDTRAPDGAQAVFFSPGAFIVEGEFAALRAAREDLLGHRVGSRMSAADVFRVAALLEAAYVRQGFVLVRVVVPPQTLADGGPVRLAVIDGFFESIDTDAVPERLRARVRSVLAPLLGRRGLTVAEIERRLLIAGDTPGLALRSTLARGQQSGATTLVIDGGWRPVSGLFTADNRLSQALGRWQYGPTLAANSLLGLGEQVYAQFRSGSPLDESFSGRPRWRVLGLGADVPVGIDGWRIGAELTDARTHATPPPGGLDLIGRMNRAALTASYPLLRGQSETLIAFGSLEYLEQSTRAEAFDVDLSRDRYAALRARLDWSRSTPWGAPFGLAVGASQGLGGRDAADAADSGVTLSRLGAEPTFSRLDATLRISQALPIEATRLNATLAGQTSFGRPVFVSEQFLLDGPSLVTGVPSGTLGVDRGVALRAEVQRDLPFPSDGFGGVLRPYGFVAYGVGTIERPTTLESGRLTARSGGLGARLDVAIGGGRVVAVGAEWAYSRVTRDGVPDGSRLTATLNVPF
jgi:hypothetical protein